jgi:hypothetical protein
MEDDPTDHEELNFFGEGPEEEIVFYSENYIEESMQDNFEVYLDV